MRRILSDLHWLALGPRVLLDWWMGTPEEVENRRAIERAITTHTAPRGRKRRVR